MIRPDAESKPLFAEIAEVIAAEANRDRLRDHLIARGIPVIATPDDATHERDRGREQEREPESRVGIWRPQTIEGERWFVREPSKEQSFWADVDRIPPKRRPRLVWFGESAARAHFFDPHFTFAAAIRRTLAFADAGDIEVIDLARTDQTAAGLTRLLEQARALEPDTFVIFAGNNWGLTPELPGLSLGALASVLQGGGASALRAHCEELLRAQARGVIATALTAARGTPVVFVVPEFNLEDWRHATGGHTPFSSGEDTRAWEVARDDARQALERGDLDRVETAALHMIALDRGTTPDGYALLADRARRQGRHDRARAWLERARDATLFLPVLRSPRCYGVVQQVLRQEGPANGVTVIDLPEVFADGLSGELPDRRLFLDYCHLTLDGIRLVSSAIVERLLPLLNRSGRTRHDLARAAFDVPAHVQGAAQVRAAIHNAHWGQPRELAEFHCREALRADPSLQETMLRFLDASVRRAPAFLCASIEPVAREAAAQDAASLQLFNSLPPLRKPLNLELTQALVSVLTPHRPDLPAKVRALTIDEYCVGNGPCDLLQRAYSSTSLDDWDWSNAAAFYRARNRRSVFRLVCCRPKSVSITASVRNPRLAGAGEHHAIASINGMAAARIPVSAVWQTHQFDVPAGALVEGVNTLAVEWPVPDVSAADRLHDVARALARGRVATVALIYAEVSRLQAIARTGDPSGDCDHAAISWSALVRGPADIVRAGAGGRLPAETH